MPANTFLPTFSVCILTCDHPEGLQRALQAVAASTMPPHQLIVTDDSSGYATREMMRRDHPDVTYLEGPRRCRAANRNRALRAATGSHVLFLDDQTLLGPTFLQQMAEGFADDHIRRATVGCATPLILTGIDACRQSRTRPRKASFLGHPTLDYRHGDRLCSVVVHSTVFPRSLFDSAGFDEHLAPGYDTIDLASRAVHELGYRIQLIGSAINEVASRTPDEPATHHAASRLYVTFRRYRHGERRRTKAAAYLALALLDVLAHDVRHAGWRGTSSSWATARDLWTLLHAAKDDGRNLSITAGLPGSTV